MVFKRFIRIGLLLLGTLIFSSSFSQENYIPGYIIKLNQDTINGLIDYRNWGANPDNVAFKIKLESTPKSFHALNIIEFGVKSEIYVSGIVKTEVSESTVDELKYDPEIKLTIDTTFLQTLFRGKKELYYYNNKAGRQNFYIKQNSEFDLLVYKKYLKQQDGNDVIIENKKYLGQLVLYLNDCSSIQTKLKNTSYTQESLTRLFQYYHKCSPSELSFQRKEEKLSVEIGMLVGASITSLNFSGDDFAYLVNANYSQSSNFSAGLFFDLILRRNHGKWSINNELTFSTYSTKGSYKDVENEDNYSITRSEFGYSYLKINSMLRYKHPIGHTFLFFNGGLSNGFAVTETNYKMVAKIFYTTESLVNGMALDETRKYELGLILGTGIKYRNFSIEFRIEKGNGMSTYMALKSSTNRYYCFIGYKF